MSYTPFKMRGPSLYKSPVKSESESDEEENNNEEENTSDSSDSKSKGKVKVDLGTPESNVVRPTMNF